jgi:hypothetical protein
LINNQFFLIIFFINNYLRNGSDAEKKKASFFLRKKFPHLIGCSHLRIETEAEPEDPIIKKEPINDRNEKNGSVIGASSDLGTELQKDPLDHSLELKKFLLLHVLEIILLYYKFKVFISYYYYFFI